MSFCAFRKRPADFSLFDTLRETGGWCAGFRILPSFSTDKSGDHALLSHSLPKFVEFGGNDAPDGFDDSTLRALMSTKRTLMRRVLVLSLFSKGK